MKITQKRYLIFTLLITAIFSSAVYSQDAENPNIIYILADDMGFGDVQALNPEGKIKTPHLDALVHEGMHFTDAHSSSSVCTPTRYGILTGRYNWRSRLKKAVISGYHGALIEAGRPTVASFLKKHGYQTHCVGKWHLGCNWQTKDGKPGVPDPVKGGVLKYVEGNVDFTKPIQGGPTALGFDTWFGHSASLDMPPYVYIRNDKAVTVPTAKAKGFGRKGLAAEGLTAQQVLPDLTDEAVKVISEWKSGESHFMYFPLPAPHTPIVPTKEWRGKSGINAYGDFCMQVDHTVGRVTQAIKKAELEKNTLIIFTADNGCSRAAKIGQLVEAGHHHAPGCRGSKSDIYEGGHRVAFIAKWPAKIKAGTASKQLTCLTDLFATCADILGKELAQAAPDSVSMLPAFLGKASGSLRENCVHHSIKGNFAIRKGKWKLCFTNGSGGWGAGKADTPMQLFDLDADLGEENNLYSKHPEIVKELTATMEKVLNSAENEGETKFSK